jgi:membrane protease YdiL (CAAX protease family)
VNGRTRLGLTAIGLGIAYALFAFTFRGPRRQFWQRMTMTGLALGGLAVAAEPALRRTRFRWRDVLGGLASAGVLYAIFQVGDRIARRVLRKGGEEISQIYGLERLRPREELAARLAFVIAPAEELFWRGLLQGGWARKYGVLPGLAMSVAAYGGAHLVTGNLTLIAAATVVGGFWGILSALGAPLSMLIVSHAVWDVFIFLVAPTVRRDPPADAPQGQPSG